MNKETNVQLIVGADRLDIEVPTNAPHRVQFRLEGDAAVAAKAAMVTP